MKLNLVQTKREEKVDIYYQQMTSHIKRIISTVQDEDFRFQGWDDAAEKQVLLYLRDIYYFESVDRKSFAYLKEETYRMDMTLGKVIEEYEGQGFLRVNKSQIVNIYKIKSIKPTVGMRFIATLDNGEKLVINRSYRTVFEKALADLRRKKVEEYEKNTK